MPGKSPPKPTDKFKSPRKPHGPRTPPRGNYKPLAVPVLDGFDMVGVRPTKGYALIKQGRIKTFHLGRRHYATVESLEQLIASGTQK